MGGEVTARASRRDLRGVWAAARDLPADAPTFRGKIGEKLPPRANFGGFRMFEIRWKCKCWSFCHKEQLAEKDKQK
jgi:hypothetical protein